MNDTIDDDVIIANYTEIFHEISCALPFKVPHQSPSSWCRHVASQESFELESI